MDPIIANTFNIIATKNNFSEPTTLSEIEKAVKSGINSQVAEGFLTSPQAAKAYNQFLKAKQGLDENGLYVPVFKEGGKIKIKKYENAAGPLMAEEAAPVEEAPTQTQTTSTSPTTNNPPKKLIPGQVFQTVFENIFTGHSLTEGKGSFASPGTFGSFLKNISSDAALTFSAAGKALLEHNVEDEYIESAYNEITTRLNHNVIDTLEELKGSNLAGVDFNFEGVEEFKNAVRSGNKTEIQNAVLKISTNNVDYFSININAGLILRLYDAFLNFKTDDNKVNINELKGFLNSEDQAGILDAARNLFFTSLAGKALTSGSKNPNVIAVNDLLTARFNPKEILEQETKDYKNAKLRTWGAIAANGASMVFSLASITKKVIRAAQIAKNAGNANDIVRGGELLLDRLSAVTGAGGGIMDVVNDVLDDRDPLISAVLAAAELIPGAGDVLGAVKAIKKLKDREGNLASLTKFLSPVVTDGFDILKVGEAIGKRNNKLYNREFLTSLSRNLGIAVGTKSARVLYGLQALEDLDNRQAREQWVAGQASSKNPEVKIVTSTIPVDNLPNEQREELDQKTIKSLDSNEISNNRKKLDLEHAPAKQLNTTYGNAAEYALAAGTILSAPQFLTKGFDTAAGVYNWITKPSQVREIVKNGKNLTLSTREVLKEIPDDVLNKDALLRVQKTVQQAIDKGKEVIFKTYEGKNYVVIGKKAVELPKPKTRIPTQTNSKGGLLIRKHKIGQYLKAYPKASFGAMLKKGVEYLGSNFDARDLASIGQVVASIPTKLRVPQKPLSAATPLPGIAPQQNYINKISEAQFTIPQTSSNVLNTVINASMLNQQLDFKNKYAHQFNQLEQQRSLQNQQTAANNLAKNDEIAAKNTMLDNDNRLASAKMQQAAMETFRKNIFAAMQDKFMREDADMQKYITAGATYTQARQQAADAAVGNVAQEYQRRSVLQQQLATKEQWINTLNQQLTAASEENKPRIQEAIDLEQRNIELTKQNIKALDQIINPVFETAQGIRNDTLAMQKQLLEQLKPRHSKFSFPLKKSGGTISYYKEAKETISTSTKSSNSDGRKHFADAFKYAKFLDFQIKNLQRVQKATDDAMDHLRELRKRA